MLWGERKSMFLGDTDVFPHHRIYTTWALKGKKIDPNQF